MIIVTDLDCLQCEHCIDDDEGLYCIIKKCKRRNEMINSTENKRCLECGNSACKEKDSKFVYECTLSKKKCQDCLREIKDYFKEV